MKNKTFTLILTSLFLISMVSAVWYNPLTWFNEETGYTVEHYGKWSQKYSNDDRYFLYSDSLKNHKTTICLVSQDATNKQDLGDKELYLSDEVKGLSKKEQPKIESTTLKMEDTGFDRDYYGYCYTVKDKEKYIKFGEHSTVLTYEEENLGVKDDENNLISEVTLTTEDYTYKNDKPHKNIGYGKDILLHEFKIVGYQDYDNLIENIHAINMETNQTVDRNLKLKYLEDYVKVEEVCINGSFVDEYIYECSDYENQSYNKTRWVPINQLDITNGETIDVAVFGDIQKGDYIDVVFNLAGEDIGIYWATVSGDLSTDLVAYYELEDNEATTTVVDSHSTYTGTAQNNTQDYSVTGKISNGFQFVKENFEYFTISSDIQDLYDGDFTIAFWLNPDNTGVVEFMHSSRLSSGDNKGLDIFLHNTLGLTANFDFGGSSKLLNSGASSGSWQHIVVRREGTNLTLWRDNTIIDDDTSVGNDANMTVAESVKIGKDRNSDNHFDGKIDELGMWERALSDSEISTLYNSGDGIEYGDGVGDSDTNSPVVTLITPVNDTNYTIISQSENFTCKATDDVNLDNITFFLWNTSDGSQVYNSTNSSPINNTNTQFSTTIYGGTNYTWNCQVYDNSSNSAWATNNFTINVYIDAAPVFDSAPTSDSINYGTDWSGVDFELTNNSDADTWWVNHSRFTINSTGYLNDIPTLSAGTYSINVSVNDSVGQVTSTIYSLEVNQSEDSCSVLFNDTSPQTYGDYIRSYSNCTTVSTLYLNGTEITNNSEIQLGAGSWNFTVIRTDKGNYSNVYDEELFTIDKKNYSEVMYLFVTSPITYGTASDLMGIAQNSGSGGCTLSTYRNGVVIAAEDFTPSDTDVLGADSYEYVFNTSGCANYTAGSVSETMIVQQSSSNCDVLFNESSPLGEGNLFKVYTNCDSGFQLLRNGTGISNNSVQSLAAGSWNFTVTRNDTANYSNYYDTEIFIVSGKAIPTTTLTLSPSSTLTYPFPVNISCISDSNGDLTLLLNGTDITSLNNINTILGVTTYNITCITNETATYESTSETDVLTINENTGACGIYFSKTSPILYPNTFYVYTSCSSEYTLSRNGTTISNSSLQELTIGSYNFTVIRTDQVNYTYITDTGIFVVSESIPEPTVEFTEPLALKRWLVEILAGNTIIFTAIALIAIFSLAGFFRMNMLLTGFMAAVFIVMFRNYIDSSIWVLVLSIGALATGYAFDRINR